MPITGKQFELGIDSTIEGWMRKIHQFLTSHRDEAFTLRELADSLEARKPLRIGVREDSPFAEGFEHAVEKLLEIGAADTRIVGGENYYRVGPKPMDL